MYCWETTAAIVGGRVVAIVRSTDKDHARMVSEAVIAAGITTLEITYTTPGALDLVRDLTTIDDGRIIGMGTVLDAAGARLAIEAGARFLVSPNVCAEVITTGNRYGAPVVPGAQTPTEAMYAAELGAAMIKMFPATALGPGYLRAVRAAMPQIGFMPTGGIDEHNAQDWLEAGAVVLGIGGALTTGDTSEVAATARRLLAVVH